MSEHSSDLTHLPDLHHKPEHGPVRSRRPIYQDLLPPCNHACPAGEPIQGWLAHTQAGRHREAWELLVHANPFPAVHGRVCYHPCESSCNRERLDGSVSIHSVERFLGDLAIERGWPLPPGAAASGHRVLVVGAGPSGLSAAYHVRRLGHDVVVRDAGPVAGGMMHFGIPAYRLPRAVLDAEVARLVGHGVLFEFNHRVEDLEAEWREGSFAAVFLAVGAHLSKRAGIPARDAGRMLDAVSFLRDVEAGTPPKLGRRVAVYGGGNTAMDAARTACRLTGRPATVVYRRTREEMPACEEEVAGLLAEGNVLEQLVSPVKIRLEGGRVAALRCVRNRLGEAGPDGRPKPAPIPGSEFDIEADSIVVAVGQRPDLAFLGGSAVSLRRDGSVVVDPHTGLAGPARVYAGGDVARGPAIIVEACADGRRAAEAICRELGVSPDGDLREFQTPPAHPAALSIEEIIQVKQARARTQDQHQAEVLPATERHGFDLIEPTLTEETARLEAARCLQCSTFCDKCVEVCPNRANYACHVTPISLIVPRLACRDGKLVVSGQETFQVSQARQIVHLVDLCNECGNCATFCVHQGRPYHDKPRLFLREGDFLQQENNAFYVEQNTIRRREGNRESRLMVNGGEVIYQDAHLRLHLSPSFEIRSMALRQPFDGDLSLAGAAEMMVILTGVSGSLPFLLEGRSEV